jgi:hypothetical protein
MHGGGAPWAVAAAWVRGDWRGDEEAEAWPPDWAGCEARL